MKQSEFASYHPLVNFFYFVMTASVTMFSMHPVFLTLSLVSATALSVMINRSKTFRFNALAMLPMLFFLAVVNPFFSRKGVTILFPLGDSYITLESVVYGIFAAVMLVAILILLSSFNAVIAEDKLMYLLSRLPSTALIISMVFRLVPRFKRQIAVIAGARKAMGLDPLSGKYRERVRNGLKIISILLSWAMENALETADSMKARGYGLPGRSSFTLFRFSRRDRVLLAVMLLLTVGTLICFASGQCSFVFYPRLGSVSVNPYLVLGGICFGFLSFLPIILELGGELSWRFSK